MTLDIVVLLAMPALAVLMVGGVVYNLGMYRGGLLMLLGTYACGLLANHGLAGLALGSLLAAVAVPVAFTVLVNLVTRGVWNNVRKDFPSEPSVPPGGQLRLRGAYRYLWQLG